MSKEELKAWNNEKATILARAKEFTPEAFLERIVEKEVEKIVEVPKEVIKEVEVEKIVEVDNPKHLEAIEILTEENKTLKSKIAKFSDEISKLKKAISELTGQ